MRRGLSVIVLMAIALVVYLVMSDQPLSVADSPASSAVSIKTFSAVAHDDSGRPILASDEVSAPRRDSVPAQSPTVDYNAPALAIVDVIQRLERRYATGQASARPPALSALQILRC